MAIILKCPFRAKEKVDQFWKLIELYKSKTGHLYTKDGQPSIGNSFSTAFWGGYNGETVGMFNYREKAAKESIGYVWYRAGQIIRESEQRNPDEED